MFKHSSEESNSSFVAMNKIDAKIKKNKSNIITFGSQISPVFVYN